MTFPLSRALSAATAAYAVFALVKPRHLGDALKAPEGQKPAVDLVAYTYAARDIPVSAVGMFASSPTLVTASMVMRIFTDFADATVLGSNTKDPEARKNALMITTGWGVLNTAALLIDRRSLKK
ncbi:hypothetical protein [Ornithinimicrobium sp. INDO-MA30-4]|uniref:hypothetical protein n=1 Tax=Ornithinimicrobium sp. INDO-MA30-4 TaxID=2908651 RepID=UPI001F35BD93|nr:hypothetical protein [Ornithinimicrobium sp. INDO-MA30-4]UJH70194.1 hypothetical protein L0A91_13570 [Ornithinimicrobium sp. INDO-MA30-4]